MSLSGPPDGAPRLAAGAAASAAIGVGMLLDTLAPPLRTAGFEWAALLGEHAATFGHRRRGRRTCGEAGRLFRATDGWLAIQLPRPDDWRGVPAWLEIDLDDRLFESDAGWDAIEAAVGTRRVAPVVERARLIGLACAEAPRRPLDDLPLFHRSLESHGAPRGVDRPLRVLDLSTLWAGPLATSLLAHAGASVLKVESPERPDGARRGPADFFALMNAGKLGAALDLNEPSDRTIFAALLDEADVVVESARPRALRQFRFVAEDWVAAQPARLWLSITGYGRAHEWIAFGDDAAIAAGLGWAPGAEPDDPCFCGDALADPLTGLHAAAVALAHASAGRGGLIDLPLRNAAAFSAAIATPHSGVEIRRERGGYVVRDGDDHAAVAAPRARAVRGAAPPLAKPTAATLDAWRSGAC